MFIILARLSKRGRLAAAAVGAVLVVGALVHEAGGPAAIYERIQTYRAERRRDGTFAMQTRALPVVDQVDISVGVPVHSHESGDLAPGPPVVLNGADAERFAQFWRSRTFERSKIIAREREVWYVRILSNGKLLLNGEVCLADGNEWCTLGEPPANQERIAIKDPGGLLLDELRKWAPVPNTTRATLACRDAQTLALHGLYDDAIREFQEALRLDSTRAGAYCGIAEAQLRLGKHDRAIEGLTKAIALWPENYLLFERRAQVYLCCGKYLEAIDDCTQLIFAATPATGTEIPRVRDLRGQAYMQIGMLPEALADFNAAVLACPESLEYRIHKRFALDALNKKPAVPTGERTPGK